VKIGNIGTRTIILLKRTVGTTSGQRDSWLSPVRVSESPVRISSCQVRSQCQRCCFTAIHLWRLIKMWHHTTDPLNRPTANVVGYCSPLFKETQWHVYDMRPSRFTSHQRGRCAADFIALKNPSLWPGFETATFGSSGQHTNHCTTKAMY
jgi:hypothetical protein